MFAGLSFSFSFPSGLQRLCLGVTYGSPFYCQASLLNIFNSILASLLDISNSSLASLLNISNSSLASLLTVSQSILPSVWLIVHFNASAAITVSNA